MIEGIIAVTLILWVVGALNGIRDELKKSNRIKRD